MNICFTNIRLNARDATDRASVCADFSCYVCSPPLHSVFRIPRHFFSLFILFKMFAARAFESTFFRQRQKLETNNITAAASPGIYIGSGCMCSYLDFIFSYIFSSSCAFDWIKSIHHELMAPQVVSCETKRKECFCFVQKTTRSKQLRSHRTTHSQTR